MTSATGIYLYGLVPALSVAPETLAGEAVGSEPARLLPLGDLEAIVSDVPLDEYDEQALPGRLEDLAWLGEKARAHEAVLERALTTADVVPFRFCTIYRGEDELRRFVGEREEGLRGVLTRVQGHVELGVKGLVDRERPQASLGERKAGEDGGAGTAYLRQRQRERRAADEGARVLAECGAAAHARLAALAVDARLNAPREGFLNGAYLVPVRDDALIREADALTADYEELGVRFEVTGPWPPYNFVPPDALEP